MKRKGSKAYSLLYSGWELLSVCFTFLSVGQSWRTYLTLGTLTISCLDLSGAECLLQRRWMQLEHNRGLVRQCLYIALRMSRSLYVLTVCQRLNLLAETSEVRLSESILGRYPLLGLELKRGTNGGDVSVRTGWFFFLIKCIQCVCIKDIHGQHSLPAEAATASHDHRCLSCDMKYKKHQCGVVWAQRYRAAYCSWPSNRGSNFLCLMHHSYSGQVHNNQLPIWTLCYRGEQNQAAHLGAWLTRGSAWYWGKLYVLNSSLVVMPGQVSSVGVPVGNTETLQRLSRWSLPKACCDNSGSQRRRLTKDAKYEVKLILHSRSREQRSASDHFIKDAAHTPGQRDKDNT